MSLWDLLLAQAANGGKGTTTEGPAVGKSWSIVGSSSFGFRRTNLLATYVRILLELICMTYSSGDHVAAAFADNDDKESTRWYNEIQKRVHLGLRCGFSMWL